MRTRWLWIAAALTLALAVGGYFALQPRSDTGLQATPTCEPLAPAAASSVIDSSGVEVVERGFSRVGPNGSAKASMGVVLRNRTDKVAYRTLVTFDAVDPAGRTVIHEIHRLFRTQTVPTIRPGESVSVGSANALDELTQREGNRIASIVVTVQVGQWLEPRDGSTGLGRTTATVVAGSGKKDVEGRGEVTYDIESTNCARMAPRGVALVFRDRSGEILGGSLDNPGPLDTCKPGSSPGRQSSLTQSDIPARTDLDRTSVTVYCDFDRPQVPLASGVPYN